LKKKKDSQIRDDLSQNQRSKMNPTYAQTKAAPRFFSEYYSSQLHGVQLRREGACLLVSKAFLQETVGWPWAEPGSSTGHHVGWVSAEARRQ
jgi:hypothetical protein